MSVIAYKVAVAADTQQEESQAHALAKKLNLSKVTIDTKEFPFLLVVRAKRLELKTTHIKTTPIAVDFLGGEIGYRVSHKGRELIAKAVGIKAGTLLKVLDLTAGLGTDAFILASRDVEVTMVERSPIIGALLADGLQRFYQSKPARNIKLTLSISEARDFINGIFCQKNSPPDVIYLDPMYPERSKSALGKKEMRVLREIVGGDEDAGMILEMGLKCAKKRVVVKRPRLAPTLTSKTPDTVISAGKSSRFDVYIVPST